MPRTLRGRGKGVGVPRTLREGKGGGDSLDLSWAARSDLQLVTTTSYNRNSYSIKETVEDSSAFPVKKLFVEDCRFVIMQRWR